MRTGADHKKRVEQFCKITTNSILPRNITCPHSMAAHRLRGSFLFAADVKYRIYAHSFRNTSFHTPWGVHDFTHPLYIYIYTHYILLHLSVLGLCMRTNDWLVCLD